MQLANLSDTILGQYRLIEEIGHGGMSNIYRAYQASVKREVAIKVLSPALQSDSSFVERFNYEVEVAAQLQHPYIVPVYDFGEQNHLFYIAMAYVRGGTLSDLVEQSPLGMPIQDILHIITNVADGLDYAHTKGIIHRDLKPGNILLDERKNPYIADFGLAKVLDQNQNLTLGTGLFGTPAYMAPEMTTQSYISRQADVYALGIILFEMLTGQKPYQSKTIGGLISAHINQKIPNVLHYRKGLPEVMKGIIEKVLAKDPLERYQDAKELVLDLQRAFPANYLPSGHTPIPGTPTPSYEISQPFQTTNTWLKVGFTFLSVLVIALGFFAFRNQTPQETPPPETHFVSLNHPIDILSDTPEEHSWSYGCLGKASTALVDLNCQKITIALENRYLPFNYVEFDTGAPGGLDYDMWWEICNQLHCEPVFIEHKWDGLIDAVGNNIYDVASGGVTITEERKEIVSFSISYLNIEQRIIARRGEDRFTNMIEFAAKNSLRIGAQADSTNLEIAQQYLPNDRIKTYNEYSVLLYALTIGEIDAAIVDNVQGQEQISGVSLADAKKLEIVGASLSSDQLGLAFQKNSSLVDPIDLALKQLRATGRLVELINKYFGPDFNLTYNDVGLGAYGR